MKHFTISFTIREDRLSTMVSLLSGEVADMRIAEVDRHRAERNGTPHKPHPRSLAKNNHWAKAHESKLFALMTPGVEYHSRDTELTKKFTDHPKSFVGSLLSSLSRLNRLRRVRKGWYVRD